MTTSIGIYCFPDVEALDLVGPYEVFTTANRLFRRRHPAAEDLFAVFTVARTAASVRARAGLTIQPEHTIASHPPMDVLVVPGGVVTQELERQDVIQWIAGRSQGALVTASVCTGAFLLAKAGLLSGKSATTHWEDIADLQTMFPEVCVVEGPRWIDSGSVVTSAGISAGIDMSLHLVERLAHRELARATARQMDLEWREEVCPNSAR